MGLLTQMANKTQQFNANFSIEKLFPYRGHILYTVHRYVQQQSYNGYFNLFTCIQYMNKFPNQVEMEVLDYILDMLYVETVRVDSLDLGQYDPLQLFFREIPKAAMPYSIFDSYRTFEIRYHDEPDIVDVRFPYSVAFGKIEIRKIYPANCVAEIFGDTYGNLADTRTD